jgi:phosphomevalonate kinase
MPEASAPGKLVIVGEYAVLEGAPAIAMAVDVRARASVLPATGPDGVLVDPISGEKFFFRVIGLDGLTWQGEGPGRRGTILEAVMATIKERLPEIDRLPVFSVSLDTNSFYFRDHERSAKLGLGSSAAALVALVGALTSFMGLRLDNNEMRTFCCAAHRRFQAGQGSGIDVSTSLLGGAIGMRVSRTQSGPDANRLTWPTGLFFLPIWSGHSASTTELLARFTDFRRRCPEPFHKHLESLRNLAEMASAAWLEQSVVRVLNAISEYDVALRALDSDASIGIETRIHAHLRRLSERHGAIYKISGAGGGDFGIAFADSERIIESVRKEVADEGFFVLDSALSVDGLTIVD